MASVAELLGWSLNGACVVVALYAAKVGFSVQPIAAILVLASGGFGLILSAQIIRAQVHTAENTARLVDLFERWLQAAPPPAQTDQQARPVLSAPSEHRTEPSMRR